MPMENNRWIRYLSKDGSQRLEALLVGIFLFQYVNWIIQEEVIWLTETVLLVKWTLLLVGMTYLIPRLPWMLRSLLQLALVIMVQIRLFGLHFSTVQVSPSAAFKPLMQDNFSQFHPFIWFSLSAWLLYCAAMWMVQAKLRIYLMILISVLFFAVRDSFTTIMLWQEVSLILFCGLSLIILRHFSELKHRAPKSWQTLAAYPVALGIPIILLIAVTLLIGALAPSMSPILTDPYTAWKVSRGEAFTLSGKGVPVSIMSKDASSGYSRDDRQLGGGFQFDYSPVMSVHTDSRTYMRGETRSLYNGSGWEASETEKRLPLYSISNANLPQDPRFNISKLKTKEVRQTVVMSNNEKYPILFGGFNIRKLEEMNEGESGFQSVRWSPRQAELRFVARNNYPKQYTVVSQIPEYREEDLRQATESFAGLPEWNEYLQMPGELPERVKQLASDLTQDEGNPYDKVKKIEQYLSQSFPYTNEPDLSKGNSPDFVDRFLFEIKQGYCDYYSSAMVVMTRSIGIPARWVKGYSSGQYSIPPEMESLGIRSQMNAEIGGGGMYTIRNSDAHSWVEVYFDGWGWIPFEPTAGFSMPTFTPSTDAAPAAPLHSSIPTSEPVTVQEEHAFPLVRWAIMISSALIVLMLAVYLAIKFGWYREWKQRLRNKETVNFSQKIVVEFERLLRYGRRKGYMRQEHETIREAVDHWSKQSSWLKTDLETALLLFEKAKYSRSAASEQDFLHVNQTIEKLRGQMK